MQHKEGRFEHIGRRRSRSHDVGSGGCGQPGSRTAFQYRWTTPGSMQLCPSPSPLGIPPTVSSPAPPTATDRGAYLPTHDAGSLLSQLHPESLHAPQREDRNNASIRESGTDTPLEDCFQHATPADGLAIDA